MIITLMIIITITITTSNAQTRQWHRGNGALERNQGSVLSPMLSREKQGF